MQKALEITRRAVRALAALLFCLCLTGAADDGATTTAVVIVGGALLALLAQGWALHRGIDQKLADRIKLHEQGCPVQERLARIETKLEYIEKAVNRADGSTPR